MKQTPLISGVFWQQLAKSGLLSPERTASLARELQKREVTDEVRAAQLLVKRGLLTRYQADRLLEGRSRGFFFDQYRILDLLGAGGMGWVYRACDSKTEEVVALKVLLDRHKEDRGMLARFQQEARAGLLLDHPHIVRTKTTASAGGLHYMVLEFVPGPSLLELLMRQGRLSWSLACDIARQIALGLHHAHQFGLVHRDVKPQNLLIDQDGHAKLLDFGLAMKREGEGGDEFSMAMIFGHECIGTPAFMAPEQAKDSLTADARSDVYGLGCTLYAALTGDTPFPYRNPQDVIRAHQTQPARSVRELVPAIPQGVADIVAKMLAKNPDDRYATAELAAQDLAKWSKPEPVEFDLQQILAERNQHAMDRVAELHRSRPVPSGPASSTTRLSKLSSVAQKSGDMPTFDGAKSPRGDHDETQRHGKIGARIDAKVICNLKSSAQEAIDNAAPHRGKTLTPLSGGDPAPLTRTRIVIGRAGDCDLQIPDSSISGHHCELQYDGSLWWVTDLKSRNGTRVNGGPITRRQLADGDVIALGASLRLRFGDTNGPATTEPQKLRRSLSLVTVAAILISLAAAVAGIVFTLR